LSVSYSQIGRRRLLWQELEKKRVRAHDLVTSNDFWVLYFSLSISCDKQLYIVRSLYLWFNLLVSGTTFMSDHCLPCPCPVPSPDDSGRLNLSASDGPWQLCSLFDALISICKQFILVPRLKMLGYLLLVYSLKVLLSLGVVLGEVIDHLRGCFLNS